MMNLSDFLTGFVLGGAVFTTASLIITIILARAHEKSIMRRLDRERDSQCARIRKSAGYLEP